MVLQTLGAKLRFGVGSNYRGWHQNVFRILPLIIGVAALATTLLLGSYLWGLVTRRKNKKQGETPSPSSDFHPRADYKKSIRPNTILPLREFTQEGTGRNNEKERERRAPLADFLSRADYKPNTTISVEDFHPYTVHTPNTIVSFREFNRPPASFSPKVADYDNSVYFEDSDAEDGYLQVLAEARSHAADATQIKPMHNSPERYESVQSWLARSPDIRHHSIISLEDSEEGFSRHRAGTHETHQHKASKSWKKLMFWKRSKQNNQFEFNATGDGMIHSSCTTPIHHLFKSSMTRATVAPSTAPITTKRNSMNPMPKRSTSGPIYYDGTPCTPNRANRPYSSPLSAYATPTRDGLYEPTYMPLKRPHSSHTTCPSPLYTP